MRASEMEEQERMVLELCLCKGCPSYIECGEKGGFCLVTIGKSGCIAEEKGCICGACPVTRNMRLRHVFYCTRGSEEEQAAKG